MSNNKVKLIFAIYHIVVAITAYQCLSVYFPEYITVLPIEILNYYNVVASGASLLLFLGTVYVWSKEVPEKPSLEGYKGALEYKLTVLHYLYRASTYASYAIILFTAIGQAYIYCLLVTISVMIWGSLLQHSIKLAREQVIENFESNASKIN